MCGRYTLAVQLDLVQDRFLLKDQVPNFVPRYNIAPTQVAPVIISTDSSRQLQLMKWGLIPGWAKDETIGNKLINARAETIAEKPSFRKSFAKRRCIVPADGFYEWKKSPDGRSKTPMRIVVSDQLVFGFAGLWDSWRSPDGSEIRSYTIITTEPNETMREIHNRMPVILTREAEDTWLDESIDRPELLLPLLVPYAGEMRAYEVSRAVNSPANDTPVCIKPAG